MRRAAGKSASFTVIAVLLMVGITWFAADFDRAALPLYLAACLVAMIALLPPVHRKLFWILDRLRAPSAKVKCICGAAIFVLSARYFLLSATLAERDLFPKFHDEHMYLLQARMLAHGRLWMPQHELADFFDSILILVKPVYAAPYFPGTALFYVPGIRLQAAPWGTSVLIAAGVVLMFYLVMMELLDGVSGWLAVLLAISLQQLRGLSVMAMSHPPMLLLTMWAYLRWRKKQAIGWATAIGVFGGWAAITRPTDALCTVFPVGLAMLWEMHDLTSLSRAKNILAASLGLLPFLSLQLVLDKGTTGNFTHTPIGQYAADNFPGFSFGVGHREVMLESPSTLPQTRDYYRQFLRGEIVQYNRDGFFNVWIHKRLEPALDASLPVHLLFVLLPMGCLALVTSSRMAVVAGALLLPLMYAFFPVYLKHYGLIASPAFVFLALAGAGELRKRFPTSHAPLAIAIAVLAVGSLPELRGSRDPSMQAPYLADINAKLASLEHSPAVVLFHYDSGRTDVHEEPVYNLDVSWPDDAPVIRAQDRGTDNHRIFDYYAKRQPQRFFYRYDRTTAELTPMGYAKDLADAKPLQGR